METKNNQPNSANKAVTYDLTFTEALKQMIENKAWVKGDNFIGGVFCKINNSGILVTVDARCLYKEEPFVFNIGLYSQKYRTITVATMKELTK